MILYGQFPGDSLSHTQEPRPRRWGDLGRGQAASPPAHVPQPRGGSARLPPRHAVQMARLHLVEVARLREAGGVESQLVGEGQIVHQPADKKILIPFRRLLTSSIPKIFVIKSAGFSSPGTL